MEIIPYSFMEGKKLISRWKIKKWVMGLAQEKKLKSMPIAILKLTE